MEKAVVIVPKNWAEYSVKLEIIDFNLTFEDAISKLCLPDSKVVIVG